MRYERVTWLGGVLALALALPLSTRPALAQGATVSGQVTDAQTGDPVANVRIVLMGTNVAVFTDDEGRFTLRNVPAGEVTLRAIRIGYQSGVSTLMVMPAGVREADFRLTRAVVSLDEIVVTATGQLRRREIPHAIAKVEAAEITSEVMPTNIGSLIQGRAAGVQIINASGTAGTTQQIRIRGSSSISLSNEPLLIVDGIRVENGVSSLGFGTGGQSASRMNDFNPDDIESIGIVKGPSAAALYGTAAANGVIVIQTKRGRAGRPQWNFFTEQGIVKEVTTWPNNYRGLQASGSSCRLNGVGRGNCTQSEVQISNPLQSRNTAPFKDGSRRQYGLNVSGGSQDVSYYVSGDWELESGIYGLPAGTVDSILGAGGVIPHYAADPNQLKRGSFRANVQANLGEKATLRVSTGFVTSDLWLPQNDNNATGVLPSGLLGNSDSTSFGGWGFYTPEEVFYTEGTQAIERFTGSVNTTWRPTFWLEGHATAGIDHTERRDVRFQATGTGVDFVTRRQGDRTSDRTSIFLYTATAGFTAQYRLSDRISSRTAVGVQYTGRNLEQTETTGQILAPGSGSNKSASTQFIDEDFNESRTLGTYIGQQFGIDDRLFITAAIRADDNSAFGEDFNLTTYPKVGASYTLLDEGIGLFDEVRLRAAYGTSGVQPGSNDAVKYFEGTAVIDDQGEQVGVSISGAGNNALKPERSTEIEAGFDVGLFGGRGSLEATYYRRTTKDALVSRNLAPSIGLTSTRFENIGKTRNWGYELLINALLVDTDALTWDMTISGSTNDNRIIDLGCDQFDASGVCIKKIEPIVFGSRKHAVGYPLGAYFDEAFTYNDANGDGIIDLTELNFDLDGDGSTDTTVFLGYPVPRYEVSWFNSFDLFNRRIRLSGLWDYRGGHKKDNLTEAFRCNLNICEGLNDPSSSLEDQAQAQTRRSAVITSAGYLEPGWFIKLREVSLTFFAPSSWAQALRLDRLSLTVTGRNLATITDYEGSDPEVEQFVGDFGSRDFLTQPQVRYFTARLNISF